MSGDGRHPLPRSWAWTTLGEVCLINPRSFVRAAEDDRSVSFVPMAAVEAVTGRMDASQARPYREVKRGYTPFSEGDTLFAKITPCMENGKIAVAKGLANGSGCGSTEFHVLRSLGGMPAELLMYYLFRDDLRKEARGHMTGTAGQLRVPARFLSESPFPLPPLPEQRRIVAEIEKHFTRLDAAVASLRRARANLKRYRASVLKAACEGRLVPTEAELGTEAVTDAVPMGWTRHRLGDIAQTITKGTTPTSFGFNYKENGIRFVRVESLERGRIEHSLVQYIDAEADGALKRSRLATGDVLFSIAGTIGKTAIVFEEDLPANINQALAIIRGTGSVMLPEYLRGFLSSSASEAVRQRARGGAMNNISLGDLRDLPVFVPPLAEQERIVAEVERHASLIQAAESVVGANLKRAERLRQAILQRAFQGKLLPQDPTDEPATALLERIRAERERAEAPSARIKLERR